MSATQTEGLPFLQGNSLDKGDVCNADRGFAVPARNRPYNGGERLGGKVVEAFALLTEEGGTA